MLSPFDLWCRLTLNLFCGFCSRWFTFWWKWNVEVTIYYWIYASHYLSELGTPVFGANLCVCTCYVFFCVAFLLPLRQGLALQTHYLLEAVLEPKSTLSASQVSQLQMTTGMHHHICVYYIFFMGCFHY